MARVGNMKVLHNKVEFVVNQRVESTRRVLKTTVISGVSTEDPAIKAAQCVKDYIESTKAFRGESGGLFLSWSTKKPVGKTTLGRWLKEVLQLAGIDTAIFKSTCLSLDWPFEGS